MSIVDEILNRHGLCWELHPYRVVVESHPHLIVQTGPSFDLRESALKGARERVLATERKRRQRRRFGGSKMSRQVTPTAQYNTPTQGHLAISGPENLSTEGNLDPLPAKS